MEPKPHFSYLLTRASSGQQRSGDASSNSGSNTRVAKASITECSYSRDRNLLLAKTSFGISQKGDERSNL